jgi:hypothetical protein
MWGNCVVSNEQDGLTLQAELGLTIGGGNEIYAGPKFDFFQSIPSQC